MLWIFLGGFIGFFAVFEVQLSNEASIEVVAFVHLPQVLIILQCDPVVGYDFVDNVLELFVEKILRKLIKSV